MQVTQTMEGKPMFLHGTLEATIFHATPYSPPFLLNCINPTGAPAYVSIKIDNKKIASTSHESERVWNQTLRVLCAHPINATLTITLKTKCSILGKVNIQAHQLLEKSNLIDGLFPVCMENGKPHPQLKIRFMLWFKPAQLEPSWRKIIDNSRFNGLRDATFPQRTNCSVTLYQDSHHCPMFQPPLDVCGSPRNLWEDVFVAIEGAKHLIYIAGWSFNPHLILVRDLETNIPHARGIKLGELLKRKAEEGVAVRIMIWDDETSLPVIKNKGVMGTDDENALAFFKNTKVVCKLSPRLNHNFPTMFTHHQKTITVDTRAQTSSSKREIISFIGGIDLCNGRYDTEQHSLFRTLNTEPQVNDFYQTSIPGASFRKGGPREPWHDSHACVFGEAARDIMRNFEQRWEKQFDPSLLVPVNKITDLQHDYSITETERNWNVQVFRSIDHVSVPVNGNLRVERSIHEAYVEAIRRAERFIYIENQYFIGGCHLWEKDRHAGCWNLIPIEIALKIASKIKAKERFAVYIVIPMWPEGGPESESVQDILHWTHETMKMMYGLIGEAVRDSGENWHPKDYLNFFCLANREDENGGEYVPLYSPHYGTQYWNAQKHRRFMIYVHSKLMIVDDAYMLIGSANINQRSMDGQRDTEIAIGCYQSSESDRQTNKRDIHGYRMSLWYEHTGQTEEVFQDPESLECVVMMRQLGEQMWQIYSGDEVIDMEGVHLVGYPVHVTQEGKVEDRVDGGVHFPDTKAQIKGKRCKVLPPIFTT
ncbi:putative phospholipase D [Helianthus annuus]|nr:putative phospholipase D [Helianthus annuus]KAJ0523563.1 putative phospholipase D [Helianthus annuus]KAJ0698175.1 putative phospholipase D [Helianthus annuus]